MERQIFNEIVKWQDATFQQATAASYSKHLLQELEELADAVVNGDSFQVESEMADCFILLFGLAHKLNFSYDYLATIIHEKHEVNLRRKWGQPDADGVVEHVEEAPDTDANGMVTKKDWAEFRNTGLALTVNQFLHIFGWALVFEVENDRTKNVYPARVKFRGFDHKSTTEAYQKISQYMLRNAQELNDEAAPDDDFTPCDECDLPDACADHSCAIRAGLRMGNPW